MIYSVFTLAAAFSPNLTWLAILRFCAGFGLGAELSLSDTYMSELLPRKVRGRYMAAAYTFAFIGVPLAAFVGAEVRGQASRADRRLALAAGGRIARRGDRVGDAPEPARVSALV